MVLLPGPSTSANPLQFIFLLLQRPRKVRRLANFMPLFILLGCVFLSPPLFFLFPLFPCLRAGKLLLCAHKGQMSCQILSALLRKLQGGRADEDWQESSQ